MSTNAEPAELADRIGEMMDGLRRAMRSGRPVGELSPRHEAALAWLRRKGRLTTAELARREQITPQSMGATVAELIERGWVTKSKDPHDGRRELLALTDAGAATVMQTDGTRHADLVQLLTTRLSDDERELIARALDALMKIDPVAEPDRAARADRTGRATRHIGADHPAHADQPAQADQPKHARQIQEAATQ